MFYSKKFSFYFTLLVLLKAYIPTTRPSVSFFLEIPVVDWYSILQIYPTRTLTLSPISLIFLCVTEIPVIVWNFNSVLLVLPEELCFSIKPYVPLSRSHASPSNLYVSPIMSYALPNRPNFSQIMPTLPHIRPNLSLN